ncbi:hypothetical protein ABZ869_14730 [Streptomyces sp. NPDC046928]|uniref:hypothetical protein n=1 Tax=Streptomyces TaxID=1883 RepID=UPI0033CEFC63
MSLTRVLLTSGRSLDLAELRLTSTYGSMLEGYPCKLVNDMTVHGLLSSARHTHPSSPVHLLPPDLDRPDQPAGPFGPVEILPPVACVGSFRSTALDPTHDPALHRSSLTVVWFQPTTRVPSGEDAEESLRRIDWEGLAEDHEL